MTAVAPFLERQAPAPNRRRRGSRLYIYKLTTDNGGAPCTYGGRLLTLAICKPFIRTAAEAGDFLFGFAGNRLSPDNRLIYIARVTQVLRDGEYYENPSFRGRPDCIYLRGADHRFSVRPDARYHQDGSELAHDLGTAYDYRRATVLVSNDFRYFGAAAAADLGAYDELRAMLPGLRQGHRVNHSDAIADELRRLQRAVWDRYPDTKVVDRPTDPRPSPTKCA